MTTVERVLAILLSAGYRELPKPLMVGSLSFDFSHALVAEERALDLILIIDLADEKDDRRLVLKIQSLALALDVMGSKRPLTAILTSAQPVKWVLEAIGRVCRVLPVGAPSGKNAEQIVHDWLAVLLPLPTLEPVSALADWKTEFSKHLPAGTPANIVGLFADASERGKAAVENEFGNLIRDEVSDALDEGDSA